MNWKHQEMAEKMFGHWALVRDDMNRVVSVFKDYLKEYAPELVATLDDEAALDYFTKALKYRHFR